jgi:hypothetical protein
MTLLLVWNKSSYKGSFLVMFPCTHMYYNPNWFISSNFLHSILVPFSWWFHPI